MKTSFSDLNAFNLNRNCNCCSYITFSTVGFFWIVGLLNITCCIFVTCSLFDSTVKCMSYAECVSKELFAFQHQTEFMQEHVCKNECMNSVRYVRDACARMSNTYAMASTDLSNQRAIPLFALIIHSSESLILMN